MRLKFSVRVISLILSFALLISMYAFPPTAADAVGSADVFKIKITDVVNENSLAADIFDKLNEKRASAGLPSLEMNSNMLDETMVRAAELTIDTSKRNLENKSYDNSSGSGSYCYEMVLRTTRLTASSIVTQLYNDTANSAALSRNSAMKVGVGVVNINGVTSTKYVCVRFSEKSSGGSSMTSDEVRKLGDVSKDTVETRAAYIMLNDLTAVADKTDIENGCVTIPKDETKSLLFRVKNKTYNNFVYIRPYSCRSSANTVAKDEGYGMGMIKGLATGTAIITMMLLHADGGTNYEEKVTVNVPATEGEALMETSITLSAKSGYLYQPVTGKISVKNGVEPYTYSLSYTINGKRYENRNATFSGDTFTFTPYEAGTNTITVTAAGADGRNAVSEPLTYDCALSMGTLTLKASKDYVALGSSVTITSSVAGGAAPLSYKYAYKNGETIPGNSGTLTLTPDKKGSYTVVATVTDAYQSTRTAEISFEVVDPIKVSVTADNYYVAVNETSVLTASATGGYGNIYYHFSCDDENGKFEPRYATDKFEVGKFYSDAAGEYTVTVTANDGYNNTGTAKAVIRVGQPLCVKLKAEPMLVSVNQDVTLTAETTGGSGAVSYSYAYEDGTKISGTGKTATTSRSQAGNYKVIVTATDAGKHTAKAEAQFTVSDSLSAVLTSSKETINVGDAAVLTATAVGASAAAQYSFSGASGLTPSGNKVTFRPATAGSYTITVKVTDGGKTATATKIIKVNPKLTVTLSCDDGEEIEYDSGSTETVYFTATAQGGTENKTYKFVCDGVETDMGSQNHIAVNLNRPGDFTVKVTVTDENGYTANAQASVTAVEPINYLSLSNNDENQMELGESMEFTAGSRGGYQPVTYTFLCNDTDCKNGGEFAVNGNKMIFTPSASGTYTMGLRVTDRKGNTAKISSIKTIKVISEADKLKASVSASVSEIITGNGVTFTVKASGGTMPYKYTYKFDSNSSTSTQATKTYYPSSVGTHTLEVTVTDAEGSTAIAAAKIEAANAVKVSLSVSKSKIVIGESAVITADASGGFSPLTYTFTEANGAKFTQTGNTAKFTPTAAGTYTFKVYAADKNGNKSSVSSTAITVKDKLTVSLAAAPTTVEVNSSVTLKTTVTGGFSTYKYQYAYSDGTVLSGTSSSMTIYPDKAGKYTVTVTVTDTANHTAAATASFTVTEKLELTVTADKEMILVGDRAVITAQATGGSSLSYDCTCTSSGVTIEKSGNRATFTAANKNTSGYTVTVKVTDNNNAKITVSKTIKIKVAKPLTAKLSASPTTVYAGSPVTLSASSSEGFGSVTYKYKYKSGGTISGTASSATVTPSKAGSYTVVVTATDAGGYTATAEATFKAIEYTVTLTAAKTGACPGETVTITAASANGVSNSTYTFEDIPELTVIGNDTAVFKSTAIGTYTVKVTAKDSAGHTATASIKMNVAVNLRYDSTVTINDKAVEYSAIADVGQKVEISGGATGGSGDYTYYFYYKEINDTAWYDLHVPPTVKDTAIQFNVSGTYNLMVVVKDSYGRTQSETYTITVKE